MITQAPTADPLAELHGLALPPAPGWWPLAPGWWLLMVGILLFSVAMLWWWRRYRGQAFVRARIQAVADGIQQLQTLADAGEQRLYATQADHLIRQLARSRYGFDGIALSGAAWQQWLAAHAPAECKNADWRLLAELRYRKQLPAVDLQALHRQCRQWLEHNSSC